MNRTVARSLRVVARTLAVVVAFGVARPACAGHDDFDFGQQLIARGYIDYARKVFEGILKDDKRPQVERDRARYGMALLGQAEVYTVASDPKATYATIKSTYDAAVKSIDEFIAKYPQDAKADEARFEIGKFGLWFTKW